MIKIASKKGIAIFFVIGLSIALQFFLKPSFPPVIAFWESYLVYQRPFLKHVDTTPVWRDPKNIQFQGEALPLSLKLKEYFQPFALGFRLPHLANTAGVDYVWFNYFVDQIQKYFGTSLAGIRLFSIIAGVVAILGFFLICCRYASLGASFVAALALASYPTFIYMQHQYLPWMPSFAMYVISCWILLYLRKNLSIKKSCVFFGFTLLVALYIYFPMRLGVYFFLFLIALDFFRAKRYLGLKYLVFSVAGVLLLIVFLDIRNIPFIASGKAFFNAGEANISRSGLIPKHLFESVLFVLDSLTVGGSISFSGLLPRVVRENIVFGNFFDKYPLIHPALVPIYLIGLISCFRKKNYEIPALFFVTSLPYLYSSETISTHRLSAVILPLYILCAIGLSVITLWLKKQKGFRKPALLVYPLVFFSFVGTNLRMLRADGNVLNNKMEQIDVLYKGKTFPDFIVPPDAWEQRGLIEQTQYIKMSKAIEDVYFQKKTGENQAGVIYIDEAEWAPVHNQPMYSEGYPSSTFLAFYLANRGFQTSYFLWYNPSSKERMRRIDSLENMEVKKVVLNPGRATAICVATNALEKRICERESRGFKTIDFSMIKKHLKEQGHNNDYGQY